MPEPHIKTQARPPSVERVVKAVGQEAVERFGRAAVTEAARVALDRARAEWRSTGAAPEEADIVSDALRRLEAADRPTLVPAVNATGVVLHTGLGRAVLPRAALEAAMSAMAGHSTLEIDPETGERGDRSAHVAGHLCALTGAEDATVVNNDAGAVLLCLVALASGREVVVSRGELVEIGGGFRVPEVMAASGARLVEVGTTNKTRAADYERAITPDTAALLKVHPSNFRVVGFTESASLAELAEIALRHGLPVLDDLGSGALVDVRGLGLGDEPPVSERLAQGAGVVMFSGDKLPGGPQAGILVGRGDLIRRIKAHPLARALRCDKVTLALLEATLRIYRRGRAFEEVPTLRALARTLEDVRTHAGSLASALDRASGVSTQVVESVTRAGAGSLPGEDVPSFAVALTVEGLGPNALAMALRRNDPPIFARVAEDRLLLEVRTLLDGEDALIEAAVRRIAETPSA